jgi:outer membrane protein TolC
MLTRLKSSISLFVIGSGLTLFCRTPSAQQNIEIIRVNDAKSLLQVATQNSPEFKTLMVALESAKVKADKSFYALFPRLKLDSQISRDQLITAFGTAASGQSSPWLIQNSIVLESQLYDNGTSLVRNRIAQLEFKKAELDFKFQREKKTLELLSHYLDASLKKKLALLGERQLELLRKQFVQIEALYRQGLKTQRDYLRFKAQLARREIEFETFQNEFAKTQNELQEKLGFDSTQKIQFSWIDLDKDPEQMGSLDNFDTTQFIVVQLNRLQAEINSEEVSEVNRNLWPEITLSASAGHNYSQNGLSGSGVGTWGWNVQLGLSYLLFDWGVQKRERVIARLKGEHSNLEQRSELLKSLKEIEDLRLSVDQVKRNGTLSRTLLDLEKTNLASLEREYQNGKLGYLDLVSGLNDFAEAQQGYTLDVARQIESHFKIQFYKGTLYENTIR